METFLTFLAVNQNGIIILLVILGFMVLITQWLAWIFRWGRFKIDPTSKDEERTTPYVITEFLTKVISDFRNLLAVLIIFMFSLIMIYVIATQDDLVQSMQAVMATLGGLVGSIVGYYFGESAAKASSQSTETLKSTGQMGQQQGPPEGMTEEILRVPFPQQLESNLENQVIDENPETAQGNESDEE